MMIEIKNARKGQAADIARLIMTAMTDDCCLHFCGVGYGLEGNGWRPFGRDCRKL